MLGLKKATVNKNIIYRELMANLIQCQRLNNNCKQQGNKF